jgi:hypothetical protein
MADRNRAQKHEARTRTILASPARLNVAQNRKARRGRPAGGGRGPAARCPPASRASRLGRSDRVSDRELDLHRAARRSDPLDGPCDPKPFTWTKTPAQILVKLNLLNAPVH